MFTLCIIVKANPPTLMRYIYILPLVEMPHGSMLNLCTINCMYIICWSHKISDRGQKLCSILWPSFIYCSNAVSWWAKVKRDTPTQNSKKSGLPFWHFTMDHQSTYIYTHENKRVQRQTNLWGTVVHITASLFFRSAIRIYIHIIMLLYS